MLISLKGLFIVLQTWHPKVAHALDPKSAFFMSLLSGLLKTVDASGELFS